MKLETKYKPIEDRPHPAVGEVDPGARQWLFHFANGYGASVVWSPSLTQGRAPGFELAVIRFADAHPAKAYPDKDDWEITYETPITDDVINGLDSDHVEEVLQRIEELATPVQVQALKAAQELLGIST